MLNVPITMTTWKLQRQIPTTKTPSPGNGTAHGGLMDLPRIPLTHSQHWNF